MRRAILSIVLGPALALACVVQPPSAPAPAEDASAAEALVPSRPRSRAPVELTAPRGSGAAVLPPLVVQVVDRLHGTPIPDARVTWRRAHDGPGAQSSASALTDADGFALLYGPLPGGGGLVVADALGYARRAERVTAAPPRLALGPATLIRGEVRDAYDRPVPEARVSVHAGALDGSELAETTTGDDGRFALVDVDPSYELWLWVAGEGLAATALPLGEIPVGPEGPVVRLLPGVQARGIVRDGDGRPVAEARVGLLGAPAALAAESDGDGRFVLRGLPPGAQLRAITEDGAAARVQYALHAEPEACECCGEPEPTVTERVWVRALDAERGQPVSGLTVRIESDVLEAPRLARTDADGEAVFYLPPGDRQVRVGGPFERYGAREWLTLTGDGLTVLVSRAASVVVSANGLPAQASLRAVAGQTVAPIQPGIPWYLPTGTEAAVLLRVGPAETATVVGPLADDDRHLLEIEAPAWSTLRLHPERDGVPVVASRVRPSRPDGTPVPVWAVAGADGTVVRTPTTGRLVVVIESADGASGRWEGDLPLPGASADGGPVALVSPTHPRAEPTVGFRLELRDAAGRFVAGRVSLDGGAPKPGTRFTFAGLAPGAHRLVAWAEGHAVRVEPLRLAVGESPAVALTLERLP